MRPGLDHPGAAIALGLALAACPGLTLGAEARAPSTSNPTACLAQALGGLRALGGFHTMQTRYTIEVGGITGTDEIWLDARGAFRESLDVPGAFTNLTVFDGRRGWQRGSNGAVLTMSGVDLEGAVTQAYLGSYAHLVPGRMKGRVEWRGTDSAHVFARLLITPAGGRPATLHLDRATCVPVRNEQPGDQSLITTFADWRPVSGVLLPHAITQSTGDPRSTAKLTLLEARFDLPLPPRAFARPAATGLMPRLAGGARVAEVPIEIASNKPFLPVRVNDSAPLHFLFDTGSQGMMVDRQRAKGLGVKTEGDFSTSGAGEGSREQSFAKDLKVSIGALEAEGVGSAVAPLSDISPAEGREIAGLIGYDLACRFVVNVDYAALRMRFFDPERWRYQGRGASVAYSVLYGGIMVVPATITLPGGDSLAGRFIVDTGVRHALTLNRPFAEKHHLADRLPVTPEGAIGYGLGGETRGRLARVKALRIGRLAFDAPVVVISTDKGGALASTDFDGIIGGDLLRRCNVIFDHPHQRIILEPNAAFAAPFEHDMSGAFLLGKDRDFRRIEVWRVLEKSPASEAGLREGDVIVIVDGRPASEFTLDEVRRVLREGPGTVELGIRRDDVLISVRLELRRLV